MIYGKNASYYFKNGLTLKKIKACRRKKKIPIDVKNKQTKEPYKILHLFS